MSERFDAVVIGMGPAGEVAASRLLAQGLRVAIAERELIGGECAYWACIPSKTLLRPTEARAEARRAAGVGEPDQRWDELTAYRDYMIRELDDSRQVDGYQQQGATVVKGDARIAGAGRVAVGDRVLETDRIVVATGSDPRIPSIDGLADVGFWTNRHATTVSALPSSVVIVGGGPVGIELGQFFARSGADVTLLQAPERLIPREEPDVSRLILDALRKDGIDVRLGALARAARREDGRRIVTLADGPEVAGEELLIATGREARVHDLGLETIGVEPTDRGIPIDQRCRVTNGVWAIGDATGVMPFTHVGMYQGRIAAADIAGRDVRADYAAIPRVVFSDPEIAAVGLTSEQARDRGIETATAQLSLADAIARPWTYEREPRGHLGLIADRRRRILMGAWAIAPMAGEWIHYAALAIKAQLPLDVLSDTVAQFPTYTEAYLKAIERLAD